MATITIPEFLITNTFTSAAQQANNTRDFDLTLTSSVWETSPGIVVTFMIEQSTDNGATWQQIVGQTSTSGPLGTVPPHNTMPSCGATLPGRGNRRLQITVIVSAPIRLGAVIVFL